MSNTPDLIQALLEAVAAGEDARAERAALALVEQPEILPALRPLLGDANADRRWWATRSLALIGGPDAERLLVERLGDDDEATRCAAALALGQLRAEVAIPHLIAALTDRSGWMRDSAADALSMVGEPAMPSLIQALSEPRDPVRVRATRALCRIVGPALKDKTLNQFDPKYYPALTALYVALNDPNRLVRTHAFDTLNGLGLFEEVRLAP